jgi:hypothetical protein
MKRLLLVLGSLAIASACGGGSSTPTSPTSTPTTSTPPTPTPTPTPSPTPASSWLGTLTAVRRTQIAPLDTTQTFEGTVTFEPGNIATTYEGPDGELAPLVPVGAASYVLKPGLLKLTHTGSVGPCSYGTGTWDVLMKKSDGYLYVTSSGAVGGRVTLPNTVFPVTVTCPTGSAQGESGVQMNLVIAGSAVGTRISGTMTSISVAGTTFSGSWSFEAR